jgi:hypothetical protein
MSKWEIECAVATGGVSCYANNMMITMMQLIIIIREDAWARMSEYMTK